MDKHFDFPESVQTDALSRAKSELQLMMGDIPMESGSLIGKTFLDIGCGCDKGVGDNLFPPVTPIFAAKILGARSFGIDIGPYNGPDSDMYTHIQKDITKVNKLLDLTGGVRLDYIHCNLLTGSVAGDIPSPGLKIGASDHSKLADLDAKILDLAEIALNDRGIILLNGIRYEKVGDTLKRIIKR